MTSQSLELESALQETLFLAIREGNLEGMTWAYEKGADPQRPSPEEAELENTSAWLYASVFAPLSTLKEIFALLERWGVERKCGPSDVSGSHPCIELTLRTYTDVLAAPRDKVQVHRAIHNGHTLAWDLWETLNQQERRRILLTLDVCAWDQEHSIQKQHYRALLTRIWSLPPSLEEFCSDEFKCIHSHLKEKAVTSSPSVTSVPEETLFWCLQSLFLHNAGGIRSEFNSGHSLRWGIHLLTAPAHVLKECLGNKSVRTLIMKKIEERIPDFLIDQDHYYENMYLQLVQRFHALGASWPEAWPEATRAQLLRFPSIRRFEEQQLLTHVLKHDDADPSPSSSSRARL